MLALEVIVDGQSLGVHGQPDWTILSCHVTASKGAPPSDVLSMHIGGMTESDEAGDHYHFRWAVPKIQIGSEVTIRVIDSEATEPPRKRYRSDHKRQENPFTAEEIREMRYEDYLELKAEFEPDASS